MLCPLCKTTPLQLSERHQVEIDYCPTCRGVWLDRGELDKIIEQASPASQYNSKQHFSHSDKKYHKKKRSSFLSDLFDF
ncbi:zf-TFIIB domain-containing protein [Piscirickettsia salmonis]|uniref:TFIIB-type zinc ribbon-containing protein n=1 Tax=Piscirickettsia salmonis TaxID=1238 RepID=UPI0007C95AEA|nr:hypothetical protein A0O36_02775 [Piscirickettsiaceae bacterium NZ-RLO1]